MFNSRTLAIIKRELRAKLFSRSFIIMTLLVPAFMIGIFSIQYFIQSMADEGVSTIMIVSDSEEILNRLDAELKPLANSKDRQINIILEKTVLDSFQNELSKVKQMLLNETITGVALIPNKSLQSKEVSYYSTNPNNSALFSRIKPAINKALIDIYFSSKKLTSDEINFARREVDFKGYRISSEKGYEAESIGNRIAQVFLSLLLYMALLFSGQMTLNSVVEEKSNKIVEILLSSVNSMELMSGKIIGTVLIQVLQMAIWLLPVFFLITTSWFLIPDELMPKMSAGYFFFFLVNYSIALFTYVGLFATAGSLVDNPQDAQSMVFPLIITVMVPFFIAIGIESNAQSNLAQVTSLLPLFSLLVMPARMVLVEVPGWQIITSLLINIIVMIGIFKLASKIYRVGILMTGKKPSWSEIIRWLREAH